MNDDNYPDWVSRTWVDSTMATWTISADRNNDGIPLGGEAWAFTDGAE